MLTTATKRTKMYRKHRCILKHYFLVLPELHCLLFHLLLQNVQFVPFHLHKNTREDVTFLVLLAGDFLQWLNLPMSHASNSTQQAGLYLNTPGCSTAITLIILNTEQQQQLINVRSPSSTQLPYTTACRSG